MAAVVIGDQLMNKRTPFSIMHGTTVPVAVYLQVMAALKTAGDRLSAKATAEQQLDAAIACDAARAELQKIWSDR